MSFSVTRDRSARREVVDEVRCCRYLASTTELRIQQEVSIPHICVSATQIFDVRAFLLKCASITLLDNKIFTRPAAYTLPLAFILGRFERMFTSITKMFHVRASTQMQTSTIA